MKKILLSLLIMCATTAIHAEVSLPSIMASHMVLQQKQDVPIWGWANPGESVTVTFAGQCKTVTTGKSGTFMVKLDAMAANATPQDLQIGTVKLTDILIGEVWLCSGQSNMEFGFRAEKGVKHSNDMVRMFHVHDHVQSSFAMEDTNGDWNSFKDGNSHRFSGVGLYFGMKLQKELGVPIGLIDASWGGTRIEPWIADEGYALIGKPLKKLDMTSVIKQQNKIIGEVEAWMAKAKQASSVGRVSPFNIKTKIGGNAPNGIYNTMVAPLAPFAIKGVIWYQGESNRGNGDYFDKLKALQGGWAKVFNSPELPLYLVQIAPFDYNRGNRSERDVTLCNNIWTAQYKAAAELKNCGIIPIHDTIEGNVKDIHPRDKKPVGERLAAMALNKTYSKKVVCSGPAFKSATAKGGKVVVAFNAIDQGLETADGKAPTWFEVSADGKSFAAADATIDGNTVIVSSAKVAVPKFVRMGWSEIAIPTLRDKNGWPVFQFSAMPVK
jgi:sialate O-acetylesterase